ncbi:Citrate lyase subunit beta-like protein, mitochondrial [Cyphellophora attinorum]|uniref:Citrate lyase subunit beta-like protein, mitochondrial n=1 Tax=Cyphellophora attinorum TaxID=1664694 RepID=A0A0N1HJG1_9EURO|nr:Citrate lyase subunit beta-like protein, mitochondrial [Phialophora attinorum]KPI36585.1 Citrate lyase subunit beta-like protein, mitochondrial [Phialophora attinorum]
MAAAASRNVLRRSMLYVPGSSQKFLDKSRTLTADCIAYDLEDSVTPGRKAEARKLVRTAIDQPTPDNVRERAVRINSVGSGLALADIQEVLQSPNLTTLVVPKVESASDVHFVRDVIAHSRPKELADSKPPITMIALIESARSLTDLTSICAAGPGLLSGLTFAAEDFALDLSLTRTPSLTEFLFARSAIVTAARAHDLPSTLDLVATAFRSEADQEQLVQECEDGVRMGFNGKQCIHPSQVATVNKVYSPSEKLVEWAVRLVIAQKKAEEQGRGAWTLDGKMIDAPVEGKARAIVAKAEQIDADLVKRLREQHKDQEPQ